MRRPLWSYCGSRRASVLVPRSASQQSNGPGTAPDAFWMKPICSAKSSAFTTSMPPTMSLWPFKYLVVECSTTSAPSSRGRWKQGVAKVLSTTHSAPAPRATAALERRDVALERFAGRVAGAGVLVAFVLPEALLDVGRGLIDRRHDGAGEGVGNVSGVHGAGRQAPDQVLPRYLGHGGNVRAP